jgi:hypothetical protein
MAQPKKEEIALTELERKTLLELTRSRVTPHGLVRRAEIVLASADGETSTMSNPRVFQPWIRLNEAYLVLTPHSQHGSPILHREVLSLTQEVKVPCL